MAGVVSVNGGPGDGLVERKDAQGGESRDEWMETAKRTMETEIDPTRRGEARRRKQTVCEEIKI